MIRTAPSSEIASIVGITRQAVERTLKRHGTRYMWRKGPGGNEKHYFATGMPEAYRIALAAKDAIPDVDLPESEDARIGSAAAREILTARATEKERAQIAREDGAAFFERMPETRKREARARFSLLQTCDVFVKAAGYTIKRYARRSKVGDKAFVEAYNKGMIAVSDDVKAIIGETTSYSTLKRISDAYYKYGVAGLAFNYHNPMRGSTALDERQQDEVLKIMCRNPQTSTKNILRALQGRFGMDVPSTNVINRFRSRWISENAELWMFYTNPDEWKNKRMFAFGSASDHVERLNQLWEADSTPADVMLIDGRHSLIGMIDVYSRRLRLLVSKTSKAASVVALIRHCLIDWGVPEIIKTDNGKDYQSKHVEMVMHGLQVHQHFCTPFQGQEKPHIERSFQTFLHGLVELMPNYIGHNVTERKAIEARRSFAERVMNKNSDPVEINMTSKELQRFCNEWTTFVYHHDAHRGLDGKKPIDMVRSWKEPIRRINDMRALDMLLIPAPTDGGMRVITKKGVQVDKRYYQSPEFAGHVGRNVLVLLDPADLGTAFIYLVNDHDERSFLCPAIDPEWVGIDPAGFATAARKHQDKIMREERKKLAKLSKDEGKREAYQDYMDLRKSQVDNVIEFPAVSREYTTPALDEAAKAVLAKAELKAEDRQFEALLQEIEVEVAENKAKVMNKEEKVVLLRSDSDTYLQILYAVRGGQRKLTRREYDWLTEFYTETVTGATYLKMEGDLRNKVDVVDEEQTAT
jgi:putative transposase